MSMSQYQILFSQWTLRIAASAIQNPLRIGELFLKVTQLFLCHSTNQKCGSTHSLSSSMNGVYVSTLFSKEHLNI